MSLKFSLQLQMLKNIIESSFGIAASFPLNQNLNLKRLVQLARKAAKTVSEDLTKCTGFICENAML